MRTAPGPPRSAWLRALALSLAAITACWLAAPALASACSCVGYSSQKELERGYARADGAISGRLINVRPGPSRYVKRYVYRVGTAYKGAGIADGARLVVESSRDGASCGLPRVRRPVGLFLAQTREERWSGNLCALVTPKQMRRAAGAEGRAGAGTQGGALCGVA